MIRRCATSLGKIVGLTSLIREWINCKGGREGWEELNYQWINCIILYLCVRAD